MVIFLPIGLPYLCLYRLAVVEKQHIVFLFGFVLAGFCVYISASILVQQRPDTGIYFNRSWADFKVGFGSSNSSYYWIGNELLYQLTNAGLPCRIRFDLQLQNGTWTNAFYNKFSVDNESMQYHLHVSGQCLTMSL